MTIRLRVARLERRWPANDWVPPGPPFVWTDEVRLAGIVNILRLHGGMTEFTIEAAVAEAGSLGYAATAEGALEMLRDQHDGFGK